MDFVKLMFGLKVLFILIILTHFVAPASASRIYTFRSTVDFESGMDDNPQVNGLGFLPSAGKAFTLVYGIYPSIFMNSTGPESEWHFAYATAINQVGGSDLDLNSRSQTFEGNINAALTRNLKMRFSELYVRSPDFMTFNLSRGIVSMPEGFLPRSDLVALRRNSHFNAASIGFDYTLSPAATLSAAFGHEIRNYEKNPLFARQLSDQNVFRENLLYLRKINNRTAWNVGYSVYRYDFREFNSALTQNLEFGLSRQISKSFSASLSAGPCYIKSLNSKSNFAGYNASLTVTKSFENDEVSVAYHHRTGTSVGIGSVSDIQDLGLSYSRVLGRRIKLNGAVSLYDASQRLDNPAESRGISVSVILNFLLNRHWAFNLGGSHQKQEGTNIFNLERTRMFISMRFMLPEFLRLEK